MSNYVPCAFVLSNSFPLAPVGFPAVATRSSALLPLASKTLLRNINPTIVETCFSYFDSSKIVSTLIVGTSMGSLFSFTGEVKETYDISRRKIMLLRIYHAFSVLTFCFGLMNVMISQVGSTKLLLDASQALSKKHLDAYTFLLDTMHLEFLLSRWSLLMSIISFMGSTMFRVILQFGLFAKRRRMAGVMVTSLMGSILCIALGAAEVSHARLPGLLSMTKDIGLMIWERAYVARHPLFIAGVSFFAVACVCSLRFLFPGYVAYDQMRDSDRYL